MAVVQNPTTLRAVRILSGESQLTLAAKSGVGQATISELERGEASARPSTLKKLSEALGVTIAALILDPTPEQAKVAKEWARRTLGETPEAVA